MTKSNRVLVLTTLATLQGCTPNDEEIWGLGSLVFSIFIILVALNALIPLAQEHKSVKVWVDKFQLLTHKVFPYLAGLALLLTIFGAGHILYNDDRTPTDLTFFLGVLTLYGIVNLKKWASEANIDKKREYIKLAGLTISFILTMLYLISGAEGLSF